MIFLFVAKRLRWLARVPCFPHLFDSLLLAFTWLFNYERVKAIEALEIDMLRIPGVSVRIHRFGGMEFCHEVFGELGHIHGHGLLDLNIGKEASIKLVKADLVKPHHILASAGWVSFQLHSQNDLPLAGCLLRIVYLEKVFASTDLSE